MRFIEILKSDIRNGITKKYKFYLVIFLVTLFVYFDFSLRIMTLRLQRNYIDESISFGTFLFFLFGGMEQYIPGPDSPFVFPSLWILIYVCILFSTLYYPFDNLNGIGKYILVKGGKRKYWWYSKCLWNFFSVVCSFLTIGMGCFLGTWLSKGNFNFSVGELARDLFPKATWICNPAEVNLFFNLIMAPFLVALAISFLQMVISLLIKPIYSFILSAFILLMSAYYLSSSMIGNYAMVIRSDSIASPGVNSITGAILSIVIIIASVFVGNHLFNQYDVLTRYGGNGDEG